MKEDSLMKSMKRILVLVMALVMAMTMVSFASAETETRTIKILHKGPKPNGWDDVYVEYLNRTKDNINVALDITWVEHSDYKDKLNLEITSGSDWDLVFDASWIHLKDLAAEGYYLRAFEIALRAYEPASVMTSYNLLNGCWTSNDPELVLGVLRQEWGFKGFVMTDWGSYLTADTVQMVNSGISWITPCSSDDTFTAPLEQATKDGRLDVRRLRENVSYMLKTIIR